MLPRINDFKLFIPVIICRYINVHENILRLLNRELYK